MNFQTAIFYFLSVILVLSALKVITSKNPVHAALFLVLCFFTGASLWLLIQAEFLGIALVLVYVGAVMVLFLFVVMMLDVDIEELRKGFWTHLPWAVIVAGLMVAEMVMVFVSPAAGLAGMNVLPQRAADYSNVKELGRLLYTDYVYPFEVASVILLVAIVAAIALTLRRRKISKFMSPADQVKVRRSDRVRIVSMASEKPLAADKPAD